MKIVKFVRRIIATTLCVGMFVLSASPVMAMESEQAITEMEYAFNELNMDVLTNGFVREDDAEIIASTEDSVTLLFGDFIATFIQLEDSEEGFQQIQIIEGDISNIIALDPETNTMYIDGTKVK